MALSSRSQRELTFQRRYQSADGFGRSDKSHRPAVEDCACPRLPVRALMSCV